MIWNYFSKLGRAWLALVIVAGIPVAALGQTTWTGMGTSTNWSIIDNWDTGVVPTGITDDVIIGAPSPTTLNISVDLNSLTVDADGVLNIGNSLNLNFGGTATTTLMNLGGVTVGNNSDFQIAGTAINMGTIDLTTAGNFTSLEIDGPVELTGGGTVTLAGASGNSRLDGVNTAFLTIVDQTIQGNGNIGGNTAGFLNQTNGTIIANHVGLTLNVDPNVDGFANRGTMQATDGGFLRLDGFGGGAFDNVDGTIEALADSTVVLGPNMVVDGGVIRSTGTGSVFIPGSQNVFLADLTLDADVLIANNSDFGVTGNINNVGTITSSSAGNQTGLEVQADGATLTGGGTIVLADNANARIDGVSSAALNIEDQTIEGRGNIGGNTISIDLSSMGTIDANVLDELLNVDPNSFGMINDGIMQASNGGILRIDGFGGGEFDNTNGTMRALENSTLLIDANAIINGGQIITMGTGNVVVPGSQNVFLTDVTLDADISIGNNSDFGITGTINNMGTIEAVSAGNQTGLEVQADGATLSGGGTVVLADNINARIDGTSNPTLIIADQTIEGRGNIGGNTMSFTLGTDSSIIANIANEVLNVDPSTDGFINNGTMQAVSGGILRIDGFGGGVFDNANGTIEALDGSEVRLDANATVDGGIIQSVGSGSVDVPGSQNVFVSDLTIAADVTINNNSDFGITGSIINNGMITSVSQGNFTGIEIQADGATISGNGEIILTGHPNSRIDGFAPVTIQGNKLSGIGSVAVDATLDNVTLAAGASVGTLTFNNITNLLNDTTVEFEVRSANATPGTDSDLIIVNDILDLSDAVLTIELNSIDTNGDPAALADFDANGNFSFMVATADQIEGFSPGDVSIDTSGFQNAFTGVFSATIGPNGSDQALFIKYGPFPLGDVNQDGIVNLLDVSPFVDAITNNLMSFEADINCDGAVNLLDVGPFIDILSS